MGCDTASLVSIVGSASIALACVVVVRSASMTYALDRWLSSRIRDHSHLLEVRRHTGSYQNLRGDAESSRRRNHVVAKQVSCTSDVGTTVVPASTAHQHQIQKCDHV